MLPQATNDRHPALRSALGPWCEAWSSLASLAAGPGALLDLVVRLWLAKIFVTSGILKAANWDVTVFLYTVEHPVRGLEPATAALIGTGIELICPLLLAFGFATRIAAVPLILTTLFLQFTYKETADHLYWLGLLALIVARGPGPLSVDRLIAPNLPGSALPFAALAERLATLLDRFAHPIAEVVVRTGAAAALWATCAPLGSPAHRTVGIVLALALAFGLASRIVATIAVGLTLTVLPPDSAFGDPVLRVLLLGGFVFHGPGPISIDAVLWRGATRLCPSLGTSEEWFTRAPRVVVVGAGFGGIAAARGLRHAFARVTLIDRRNYHLFQPLLYQVATATLSPADVAVPIRTLMRDQRNCRVLMATVAGVDTARREVLTTDGAIPFEYLVLATGARHSYFGKDSWEAFAPGLKRIDDATAMRSRILSAFERAEACQDHAERARLLTFVLVGAGPTGVELAGAIAELAHHTLRREFRTIDPTMTRVVLVQSGSRVLPALPESLSSAAERSLRALGVEVLTDARVETIDGDGVLVGNSRIEARTVLWTAGVTASPAAHWIGAEHDRAGRIVVDSDLAIPGLQDVFAIGDTASLEGPDGRPLPGLAAVAKQQGKYVARSIRSRIEGGRPPGPFRYRDFGSMATVGRKAAVADLPFIRVSGASAWWLWGLVHVAFLVDLRSRIAVVFDWFWSYLTYNRSVRLITGGSGE